MMLAFIYPMFGHVFAIILFSGHALMCFFSRELPGAQGQIELQASEAKLCMSGR